MTSARMKPRARSEWMAPAASTADAPWVSVQARVSSGPAVKKLSAEASEVMFAGDGKYEGRLMFMLMAAVGTPIYM